jgi:hypothetical protein
MDKDERGKLQVEKLGTKPNIRKDMDFEFTLTADLDGQNNLRVDKTRCNLLKDGFFEKPGEEFARILVGWLNDGAKAEAVAPPAAPPPPEPEPSPPEPEALTPPAKTEKQEPAAAPQQSPPTPAAESLPVVGVPAGDKAINLTVMKFSKSGGSVETALKLAAETHGKDWRKTITAEQLAEVLRLATPTKATA